MEKVKKLSEYSLEELKTELKTSAEVWDFSKVQEISKELLERNSAENAKIKLTEDQEKMLTKIKDGKAKKTEMQNFIDNDIKNRKSETDAKVKNIQEFKDSKIKDLEAQLKEKDEIIDKTINTLPGVLELISPKTRKIVGISRNINKMVADEKPVKDILIYCMAITKGIFLRKTRWWIKRWRIQSMRKRKDTSIIQSEDMKEIKEALAPNPSKKWTYTEVLKELLLKTIVKQQEKHAEEVKKQIIG